MDLTVAPLVQELPLVTIKSFVLPFTTTSESLAGLTRSSVMWRSGWSPTFELCSLDTGLWEGWPGIVGSLRPVPRRLGFALWGGFFDREEAPETKEHFLFVTYASGRYIQLHS